jgi:hypothetical protein
MSNKKTAQGLRYQLPLRQALEMQNRRCIPVPLNACAVVCDQHINCQCHQQDSTKYLQVLQLMRTNLRI